jgi:hypothetical protein
VAPLPLGDRERAPSDERAERQSAGPLVRGGASNAVTRIGTDRSASLPSLTRAATRAPGAMVPVMAMISAFHAW